MGDLNNQSYQAFQDKNERRLKEIHIIDRINQGDLDAFHYLYTEYYASLCIYANNFTRSKELAEEIVQDIFIELWEKQGFIKINSSLSSYLFVSVRNGCLNHLKHLLVVNKFNDYYTQKLNEAQDFYTITQETGDSLLIAQELEEKINKEIELLPEKCRQIFLMSRVDCLKHKDIADKLGVSINTVHRQTSIALERIRKSLKDFLTLLLLLLGIFIR